MKRFIAGFVFLITGLVLGAEERALIALPLGSWPETGRVMEMELLQDLRGGAYVPYIAGEEFRLLRKTEDGGLAPHMPEGFEGTQISARRLSVSTGGLEQYTAFIGRKGGSEAVYLFGLNSRDDLRYYPLEETRAAAIADYSLVPSFHGGIQVYTLAGGRLQCLSAGIGRERIRREISPGGEAVESFALFQERTQTTRYGWYRSRQDGFWEISLFALDEAGQLVREKTGASLDFPRLDYRLSPGGTPVFTIRKGNKVSVYHAAGGGFVRDLSFDAPVSVMGYRTALHTEDAAGLLFSETETEEHIYGVSHELSGAPVLQLLFSLPKGGLLDMFFTGNNRISLIYRQDQTLHTVLADMNGRIITEGRLSEDGAVLFYPDILGRNRFYSLSGSTAGGGEEETGRLRLFELEQERWNLVRELRLPWTAPKELHSLSPFNKDTELLSLVSEDSLMLCETGSPLVQTMEMQKYARSIRLNGVVFLAVSSGNGIGLYRVEE
ncbi:hypothetical protein FACS189445_6400 [Spirochaetia bacterium]|nr:hypothetical protein FACS189445_6400 [Spirochaetia bacterium]